MAKIKICGISRDEDAAFINKYRPDYFGMVIDFPKSKRSVSPVRAAELRELVSRDIPSVGVFVDEEASVIEKLAKEGTIDIIQLHGGESEAEIKSLSALTKKPVWKAFKIRDPKDIESANKSSAELVLLDNGRGTGERFDWNLISEIKRPFALAGGLGLDNIEEAICSTHPFLIDISSGVETLGVKDEHKIMRAIELARKETKNV